MKQGSTWLQAGVMVGAMAWVAGPARAQGVSATEAATRAEALVQTGDVDLFHRV